MDQTATDYSFNPTNDHASSRIGSEKELNLQQQHLAKSTSGEAFANGPWEENAPRVVLEEQGRSVTLPSGRKSDKHSHTRCEDALQSQEKNIVIAPVAMVNCEAADEDSSSQASMSATTRDALELELSDGATATIRTQQNALVRKLRRIRDHRRRLSSRQRLAVFIGVLPVALCSLEMIPDKCRICQEDNQMDAYIFTAAICGGFGAVIYGTSLDYWMPRLVGGAFSALGSLCTNWMVLTSIPAKWSFLLILFGILGAMPGVVIYFTLKIVADECFESSDKDLEDEYEEVAPLTKIRMV